MLDRKFMFDVIPSPREYPRLDACTTKNQILVCCASSRHRNRTFLTINLSSFYSDFFLFFFLAILVWLCIARELDSADWRRDF